MQGPSDKPLSPPAVTDVADSTDKTRALRKARGRSVSPDGSEQEFLQDSKRVKRSHNESGRPLSEIGVSGLTGALDSLSDQEREFYKTLDPEKGEHYLSLQPVIREKLASLNDDHKYEYFEMESEERSSFLMLRNEVQRNNFLEMDIDERKECLALAPLTQQVLCYLDSDDRIAYSGFSEGEKQLICSIYVENVEIQPIFRLSREERRIYLFVNRVAQHDGFHSVAYVEDFLRMNRSIKAEYGSALLLLYAVMHRHHAGDESTSKYMARAIEESCAYTQVGFDVNKMFSELRTVGLRKASTLDRSLRKYILTSVERVLCLFLQYHHDDKVTDIIDKMSIED